MRPQCDEILNGAADSDQTSSVQYLSQTVRASFQIVTDGTADGDIQIQVSNDVAVGASPQNFQPTNWSDLGSPVTIAGPAIDLIAEQDVCYEYLRVIFTDSSGGTATGTIAIRMASKAL